MTVVFRPDKDNTFLNNETATQGNVNLTVYEGSTFLTGSSSYWPVHEAVQIAISDENGQRVYSTAGYNDYLQAAQSRQTIGIAMLLAGLLLALLAFVVPIVVERAARKQAAIGVTPEVVTSQEARGEREVAADQESGHEPAYEPAALAAPSEHAPGSADTQQASVVPQSPESHQGVNLPRMAALPGSRLQASSITPARAAKGSRRTLWLVLSIIAVVLIVGAIGLAVSGLLNPSAANPSVGKPSLTDSSTPTKALTNYCNAIVKGDYQTAYNQLASSLKSQESEADFASFEQTSIAQVNGISVTGCSVSNVSDNGSTGGGTVTYSYSADLAPKSLYYTLTNENGAWKITREGP